MATFTPFADPRNTLDNITAAAERSFIERTVGDLPVSLQGEEFNRISSFLFGGRDSQSQQQNQPLIIQQQAGPRASNRRGVDRTASRGGVGATPQNQRALSRSQSQAQGVTGALGQEPLMAIVELASQIASAGGTEEARQASADLARTRSLLEETVAAFTPARAQQLAQGVVDDVFRQLREQIAPQINAVAEAGGASRGALRALLLQDAEARAGEVAARAVLEAITSLGALQVDAAGAVAQAADVAPISNELTRLIAASPTTPRVFDLGEFTSTGSRSSRRITGNQLRGLPISADLQRSRTRIV